MLRPDTITPGLLLRSMMHCEKIPLPSSRTSTPVPHSRTVQSAIVGSPPVLMITPVGLFVITQLRTTPRAPAANDSAACAAPCSVVL